MSKRDYYEILGVSRDVGEQELKSAYRKLALKYHPDRNPNDQTAEERFKEAAEAYAILADPDKRARYDKFGHAGVGGSGTAGFDPSTFADFNDIFGNLGDMFGFGDIFGSGRRRRGPRRGSDLRYDLPISLEDAAAGTEATLQVPREEPCDQCAGSGLRDRLETRDLPAMPRSRSGALPAGLPHGCAPLRRLPRSRHVHSQSLRRVPRTGQGVA